LSLLGLKALAKFGALSVTSRLMKPSGVHPSCTSLATRWYSRQRCFPRLRFSTWPRAKNRRRRSRRDYAPCSTSLFPHGRLGRLRSSRHFSM